MTPAYQISIAGEIIDFGNRLISLQLIQDRDRFDPIGCDSLEIVLEDAQAIRLKIPPRGRALQLAIGYEGALIDKGVFIVDETEISGPPNTLTIRAQNNSKTPHDSTWLPMNTRLNRSWQTPLTIQRLVTEIAVDHGLYPVVSPSLASIELPHIDQSNMSDLELLSQCVCRVYDAFTYVQDAKLLVLKNGSGETVNDIPAEHTFLNVAAPGEQLDPAKLYASTWRAKFNDFQAYRTVKAAWYDVAAAKEIDQTYGDGSLPILRLPFLYPDRATADAAAQTAWQRSNAYEGEMAVAMPGRANVYAGGKMSLSGAHTDLENITWYLRRVVHTIDRSGFWTEVTGERLTADLQVQIAG